MKVFYAEDLVRFACRVADKVPTIYLFGGLGDFVTPELIEEKAAKCRPYTCSAGWATLSPPN